MKRMAVDTGSTFTDIVYIDEEGMATVVEKIHSTPWDVINGFISIEHAAGEYGVIINPETMEMDLQATEKIRHNGNTS